MKSTLELIPTKDMDLNAWLAYRGNGIGGSEVATILGLNPYQASIELFYAKVGEPIPRTETIAMFMGKETEPLTCELWQYWGGDVESMITNYRTGNIVRRCRRVNAYIKNPKYPWLFCSVDRIINKQGDRGEGVLEAKNISGYSADKWEGGFPIPYIIQIQTYLLVLELTWGESALMKDGRNFEVIPFEENATIQQTIIEKTREFWDKVVKARKILTQRFEADKNFNGRMVDELTAELQALEPSPDGSDAYNNFLKEKYQIALPGERKGTAIELDAATQHKAVQAELKALKEAETLQTNILKNSIGQQGCDRLDFGQNGYVSWKADSNGVRRFLNKVK